MSIDGLLTSPTVCVSNGYLKQQKWFPNIPKFDNKSASELICPKLHEKIKLKKCCNCMAKCHCTTNLKWENNAFIKKTCLYLHLIFKRKKQTSKQIDKVQESFFNINLVPQSWFIIQTLGSMSRPSVPQLDPPAPPGGHQGSPQSDERCKLLMASRIRPRVVTCLLWTTPSLIKAACANLNSHNSNKCV